MKPATMRLLTWAVLAALTAVMILWIAPAVGTSNSACEQYPLTSGCR